MKKRMSALAMAIVFAAAITAGMATAASLQCNVVSIEKGTVTLDCGDKADVLKVDTKVRVKTVVKKKAVEGC